MLAVSFLSWWGWFGVWKTEMRWEIIKKDFKKKKKKRKHAFDQAIKNVRSKKNRQRSRKKEEEKWKTQITIKHFFLSFCLLDIFNLIESTKEETITTCGWKKNLLIFIHLKIFFLDRFWSLSWSTTACFLFYFLVFQPPDGWNHLQNERISAFQRLSSGQSAANQRLTGGRERQLADGWLPPDYFF